LEDWDVATIGGVQIQGVFQNAYTSIEGGEIMMAGTRPKFYCRSNDILAVVTGTPVIQDGVTYTVVDLHPDGTGFTNLILRK
jgi:hypothetical protein